MGKTIVSYDLMKQRKSYEQGQRDEREAAAQRLKVVRDAADVALLGTLQTTRDRVIAAIDALEKP